MDFEFAITAEPAQPAEVALRTVYCLHADRTYDVRKRGVPYNDIVALRTVGGMGRVRIEGVEELEAVPGTLLFFRHDRVRRYWCPGDVWDFWWFEFSAASVPNLPMNRLITVGPVEGEADDFRACLDLLGRADAGTARLASATYAMLFSKWMLQIESGGGGNPHRGAVEKAIGHMKANLDKPVPVAELARLAGLSERRFRQVFSDVAGLQPKRYQETLRIGTAEELLRNTPLSVGEISQRLGYSSQFHFCKAFRDARGVPPSLYRKNGPRSD